MPMRETATSSLVGYLCAVKVGDADQAEKKFSELIGCGPDVKVATASYSVCLALPTWDKVGEDAAYPTVCDSCSAALHEMYP